MILNARLLLLQCFLADACPGHLLGNTLVVTPVVTPLVIPWLRPLPLPDPIPRYNACHHALIATNTGVLLREMTNGGLGLC